MAKIRIAGMLLSWMSLFLVGLLQRIHVCEAFSLGGWAIQRPTPTRQKPFYDCRSGSWHNRHQHHHHYLATKKDDEENQEWKDPAMDAAFRQLESLGSLDTSASASSASASASASSPDETPLIPPPIDPTKMDLTDVTSSWANNPMSLEKEVQMYKEMVQEMERTNEDDLYSNVLKDMGGTPPTAAATSETSSSRNKNPTPSVIIDDKSPNQSPEDFMNLALDEALKEVSIRNPSSVDSILDNQEIMHEIEAIFERGNEQLLASLEEMRREQQDLARASATKNYQDASDSTNEDAARLAQAEASMEAMLKRVTKEATEVEQAVQELKSAQQQLDNDFITRLRKGGIVKQSVLAGFLLFSVRSILDSVASFSDESLIIAALIQGCIALFCAAVFFLL